ncbi:hypothetical protein ACQRBV_19080 [Pseudomonas sp. R11F]|uniref:hypothetical protein n=1 Tax=Pseudomonas TaxID=286 RepID=UPI00398F80C6
MPDITYGSVRSGIKAATQAWHPLGIKAAWFAEIELFPSPVHAHHYHDVPNYGEMTILAVPIGSDDVKGVTTIVTAKNLRMHIKPVPVMLIAQEHGFRLVKFLCEA